MAILRLHHAQITVPSDAEAEARAFYCGVLGLTEIEKPDSLKDRGGFWVQLGDQQVHISIEDGVNRNATKAHLAYLVTDLQTWRKRLEALGIKTFDNAPIPGLDRFEFRDPFGNRVEFTEELLQSQTGRPE